MEQPKVSVIMPVYNTEDYVQDAIESILNQTLHEIEVIIIDDGSTDRSLEIIESLGSKDARIHFFSQSNQGLSITRNVGIDHSTGEYIYFMDSDDLLQADALELCHRKSHEMNLDFLFFDASSFQDSNNGSAAVSLTYSHTKGMKDRLYTGIEAIREQLMKKQFTPSACLNFIRRSFLMEYELRFFPNIIHEDQLFTPQLYINASRVGFISRPFFNRRMRINSIMTTQFKWKNIEGYLTVGRELIKLTRNEPKETQAVINILLSQMLNAAVWQAHILPLRQRIKLMVITLFRFRKYVNRSTYGRLILKKVIKK